MNKLNDLSTILLQDTSEPDLPEKAKQRVRKQPDRARGSGSSQTEPEGQRVTRQARSRSRAGRRESGPG